MDTMDSETKVLKLRAHHICCIPFWDMVFGERGPDFLRVEASIKEIIRSKSKVTIRVIEGVDELCQECPLRAGERCNSPRGNEDKVRKWDTLLLKELDLPFGTRLTSAEWGALITPKIPFMLYRKCQWQTVCRVGAELQ